MTADQKVCPCGFHWVQMPKQSKWHRQHKVKHLAAFPDIDQRTIENLDMAIQWAELGEDNA